MKECEAFQKSFCVAFSKKRQFPPTQRTAPRTITPTEIQITTERVRSTEVWNKKIFPDRKKVFYAVEHLFCYRAEPATEKHLPCLQNPTTHYYGGDPAVISGNPNTWIDKGNIKSIYDPCPYGYRVPINGSWAGFPSKTWTGTPINEGQLWQSTWWPAAGYRGNYSAALSNVAGQARYWSSSPYPAGAYQSHHLYFNYNGDVYPSYGNSRSSGFSLRCVQE